VVCYHGGMKADERTKSQHAWTSGEAKVAVATVAFGMGVDLAHVRYVVHWTLAKSVESFYQESGRAGRDGLGAKSLVYYSADDVRTFEYLARQQKPRSKGGQSAEKPLVDLQEMVDYCLQPSSNCRRTHLLKHFGEGHSSACAKDCCDFCSDPDAVKQEIAQSNTAHQTWTSFGPCASKTRPSAWDGQWDMPHDDEAGDDSRSNEDMVSSTGLAINDYHGDSMIANEDSPKKCSAAALEKASRTLAKYDAIESRQSKADGKSSGFVHFRKKAGASAPTRIPEHLLSSFRHTQVKTTAESSV
jgi:superfamily II DNA helicase RecQ